MSPATIDDVATVVRSVQQHLLKSLHCMTDDVATDVLSLPPNEPNDARESEVLTQVGGRKREREVQHPQVRAEERACDTQHAKDKKGKHKRPRQSYTTPHGVPIDGTLVETTVLQHPTERGPLLYQHLPPSLRARFDVLAKMFEKPNQTRDVANPDLDLQYVNVSYNIRARWGQFCGFRATQHQFTWCSTWESKLALVGAIAGRVDESLHVPTGVCSWLHHMVVAGEPAAQEWLRRVGGSLDAQTVDGKVGGRKPHMTWSQMLVLKRDTIPPGL